MTDKLSRSIGGKQSIKGAAIIFLIIELILLYFETKGDFANGILFFISGQLNGIFILLVAVYFLVMFLLGRQAGFGILIKGKSYYFVGLIWGFVATLIIVAVNFLIMFSFRSHDYNYTNSEIAAITFRNFSILVVPMLLVWLWVAHKIKTKGVTS
jgi:hypothetical protein